MKTDQDRISLAQTVVAQTSAFRASREGTTLVMPCRAKVPEAQVRGNH
jgi:hypothetical protein